MLVSFVAAREDGFVLGGEREVRHTNATSSDRSVRGEFGGVFAEILHVGLEIQTGSRKEAGSEMATKVRFQYTGASLLSRLRHEIRDDIVRPFFDPETKKPVPDASPGTLMELAGVVHLDPVGRTLTALKRLPATPPFNHLHSPEDFDASVKKLASRVPLELSREQIVEWLSEQVRAIHTRLEGAAVVDAVLENEPWVLANKRKKFNGLLTLCREFITDQGRAYLLENQWEGEFKVLGKVTRIETNQSKGVNTCDRGGMGEPFIDDIADVIDELGSLRWQQEYQGYAVPSLRVGTPAVQILPLAIYV